MLQMLIDVEVSKKKLCKCYDKNRTMEEFKSMIKVANIITE